VNGSGLPTVEAAFADAAQAERAVAQLQHEGIDGDRITVERGGTARPGRTAAKDRQISNRMIGSWLRGAGIGGVTGVVLGLLIGAFTLGAFSAESWAIAIGLGVGLGVVGGLVGGMTGFGKRSRRQSSAAEGRPEVLDAVRVLVAVQPGEHDTVQQVLAENGGA